MDIATLEPQIQFLATLYWKQFRRFGHFADLDDVIQIARITAWHCTEHFNPTKGNNFETYFKQAIEREIRKFYSRLNPIIHIPERKQKTTPKFSFIPPSESD